MQEDGLTAVSVGDYWRNRPNDLRESERFYYSPSANAVFATQVGPVSITWRAKDPSDGDHSGDPNYYELGGNYFALLEQDLIVSGSSIKPPKKIFWTESPYSGYRVAVPDGIIEDVKIVYNSTMPENVPVSQGSQINQGTGVTTEGSGTQASYTGTLWYSRDNNSFSAMNRQGRLFVELLGNPEGATGIREFLGFEIVEVLRYPTVQRTSVDLGDVIPNPVRAGDEAQLTGKVAGLASGQNFLYLEEDSSGVNSKFHAVRETSNPGDIAIWWLERGAQDILWPYQYNQYDLDWPTDVAKYSHFIRPLVDSKTEAEATAVQLDINSAPSIAYQDPLDQLRAFINAENEFYTWLAIEQPLHRTLLRRIQDGVVSHERVYSWLDQRLIEGYFNNSIAVELDSYDSVTHQMNWQSHFGVPRVVNEIAVVGNRIRAPQGELGSGYGEEYLAGFINRDAGQSYHPGAYIDPFGDFIDGFAEANRGAIIPVNAIPGDDLLEVYWHRKSQASTGNESVYWPSVLGRYTLLWPDNAIPPVLASDFSEGLPEEMEVVGDGLVENGVLVLAQEINSQNTLVIMDGLNQGRPIETFTARFKVRIFNSGGSPGGGMSFNFAGDIPDSHPNAGSQDGYGSGLRITFDSYVNGSGDTAPAIDVVYDQQILATASFSPEGSNRSQPPVTPIIEDGIGIPMNLLGSEFRQVEIRMNQDGTIDLYWEGILILSGVETSYQPQSQWRFAFTASTGGGTNVETSVDDFELFLNQSSHDEIALASNDGSGPLNSLQAEGTIYYQNDPGLPGYNPNEEHAIMAGGQAFALRDDLNIITNSNGEYSSDPFVLVDYTASDGRPAMRAFKVLREKPEKGITFTYDVVAPRVLQPPMPLPLLELPLNDQGFNINTEIGINDILDHGVDGDGVFSTMGLAEDALINLFDQYVIQSEDLSQTLSLYITGADFENKQVTGVATEAGAVEVSYYPSDTNGGWDYGYYEDQASIAYYVAPGLGALSNGDKVVAVWESGKMAEALTVHSQSGDVVGLTVPLELHFENDPLSGGDGGTKDRYLFSDFIRFVDRIVIPANSISNDSLNGWSLGRTLLTSGDNSQSPYTFKDRKNNIWVYRGPHSVEGPRDDHAFDMQFYYKTLAGFYFPGVSSQPAVGTVVPYLRRVDLDDDFVGLAFGGEDQALPITYRPAWPSESPVLFTGETLTLAKRGLPAVRGQTSATVLYQQSLSSDGNDPSVVLHDPTREKQSFMGSNGLDQIPPSIETDSVLGRTYFPQLPPHLVERFFFDPNRGEQGALVFKGEFFDEVLGEDYLLINVLGSGDLATLKDLVPDTDTANKDGWGLAIDNLKTQLETFVENPQVPRTYIVDEQQTMVKSATQTSEIASENVAVDSYALSAVGPGAGYVTLLFGNGEAFTPENEPVSLNVLKVVPELYQGQVKPIKAANPLNEKVSMQQVSDFAAQVDDYTFEWKIASPVNGLPPTVSENQRELLMGDGVWDHVRFPLFTDEVEEVADILSSRKTSISLSDGASSLTPLESISFSAYAQNGTTFNMEFTANQTFAEHNKVAVDFGGEIIQGLVASGTTGSSLIIRPLDSVLTGTPDDLREIVEEGRPVSYLHRSFSTSSTAIYSSLWLSLDIDSDLGARVYVDDTLIANVNVNQFLPETFDTGPQSAPTGLFALSQVYSFSPSILADGTDHSIVVALYSNQSAGTAQSINLRLEAFDIIDQTDSNWIDLSSEKYPDGVRAILGGTADVRSLSDNYLIMRYRPTADADGWSQWTVPALAEGWIKRVLAGINPFNQRVTDFFNNRIDTDASVLTEAGTRWEGDVALNLENINDFGLIPIYETVLRRGRNLSIDADINYGPANDALLLAAGYLSDLYSIVGDEARADAANPTIGIGTADETYGDIATSLFSFQGQVAERSRRFPSTGC